MPTTTTTSQYPPWLEQLMTKVASETGRLYDAGAAPEFFPGQTVAPFNPDQIAGQGAVRDALTATGPNSVTGQLNQAAATNASFLNPNGIWNVQSIPGYNAIRQGIVTDAGRNLSENYMPSVRSAALGSGTFGGSRGQIGEALAAARSTDELTKGLGNLDYQTFNTLLNAQQQAIGRAPDLANAQLIPGQALQNLGLTQQNQAQTGITADRERFDFNQNRPWWLLDQLRASAGGQPSSTTSSTSGGGPGTWETIGGLLAALPGLVSIFRG